MGGYRTFRLIPSSLKREARMGWLSRLFGRKPPKDPGAGDSSFELPGDGVVDQTMFDAFAEAHSYDAASSMNFLNARLAAALVVLHRGKTLDLYDPDGGVSAASERDYRAWAKKHFPHARF
jgi:hypothetical protein